MTQTPSQRRLQRPPDFTGGRLESFRQIFLRHGLPGALLGLLFLACSGTLELISGNVSGTGSVVYFGWGFAIFAALSIYAAVIDRRWSLQQVGWIAYLGLLSLWEEWVFRLALPGVLGDFVGSVWVAVLISNVLFGAVHYLTLRWRWQWCVGAFVGGLALSRQLEVHSDLLLITAYHWIATFLNTPRSPNVLGRGEHRRGRI